MPAKTLLKVLLVDDSASLRRVYQKLLEACHFEVRTADSGESAMAALDAESFDVVVSDIGMPMMDGLELAHRIRASPRHASIRLVALTAYTLPSLIEQAREVGFDSYLAKPVNIGDLREAIAGLPVQCDFFRPRTAGHLGPTVASVAPRARPAHVGNAVPAE